MIHYVTWPIKKYWKIIVWLLSIAVLGSLYFLNPDAFNIDFLQQFVADNKLLVMIIYVAILSVLGLFFIPSSPFVMAGLVLFVPVEAYFLSLLGIITSSAIVYYFAQFIGLDDIFEEKYPKKIQKIKKALSHKELPIITGWSFIPVVPTDLIIYVASGLNISFRKCLFGVMIGEGILNLFYIFSLKTIFGL